MISKGLLLALVAVSFSLVNGVPIKGSPKSAVGTCPDVDGQFPVYLPDSEDCAIYYTCGNGVAIQNVCPPETAWNTQLNTCDWESHVQCHPESYKLSPRAVVGTCPDVDGQFPVYLPDSEDCAIYYTCGNGVAIQNVCPPETAWNTQLNTCDWESHVQCHPEAGNGTIPFAAVGTCPARDTNETVYLADSKDCAVYYVCSNGRPIPLSCTPGMAWNSKLNICDWEIDVDCTSSRKIAPRTAVGTCPEKDSGNAVFLPDSESCVLYYECSNGEAIQNTCNGVLQWNQKLNTCDFPENAGCTLNQASARSVVGSCPAQDPANPIYLPDSDNCQLYYECSNGVAIQNNCPDDLEFSPTLHVCADADVAGCKASSGPTVAPTDAPTSGSGDTTVSQTDSPASTSSY